MTMSDTLTISTEEIEAVAAKLDAGETLDEYDRVILRAVFLMAGSSAADSLDEDVEGFGFSIGSEALPMESLSLNFTMPGDGSVKGSFSAGRRANPGTFNFIKIYDKSSPTL
jgi:hypothetical protein